MKVALVQPPWSAQTGGPLKRFTNRWVASPPLGLLYLAAFLEQHGHQAEVYDLEVQPMTPGELRNRLQVSRVELIGVTATTPVLFIAEAWAQELQPLGVPLVLGGPHVTALGAEGFPTVFDYAVTHEGEQGLLELIAALQGRRALDTVAGLIWRKGAVAVVNAARPFIDDLDALPFPARHKLDPAFYRYEVPGKGVVPVANIALTRGCPFRCAFCAEPSNTGRRLRTRSPQAMVDEMEAIKRLGVHHVFMVDSTLTANRKLIEAFSREMVARRLGMTFEGHTRANLVDAPLLALMKEAGLVRLAFGLESIDKQVLKLMRKDIEPEDIRRAVRLCTEIGIKASIGAMMGNAGDTRDTVLKTAWFVRSVRDIRYAPLAIACPLPGTELRRQAEEGIGGLKLLDNDYSKLTRYAGGVMEVNGMSPRDLLGLQRRALIIMHSTPRKAAAILRHFGAFSVLSVLWGMVKSEVTAVVKGYDPVLRDIADQNTTLRLLGLRTGSGSHRAPSPQGASGQRWFQRLARRAEAGR